MASQNAVYLTLHCTGYLVWPKTVTIIMCKVCENTPNSPALWRGVRSLASLLNYSYKYACMMYSKTVQWPLSVVCSSIHGNIDTCITPERLLIHFGAAASPQATGRVSLCTQLSWHLVQLHGVRLVARCVQYMLCLVLLMAWLDFGDPKEEAKPHLSFNLFEQISWRMCFIVG